MRFRFFLVAVLMIVALGACSKPPRPTVNLYQAVHIGDLEQLKRHIYWGTDVNLRDVNGDFPLHVAARTGSVAIARELARNGARLDVLDAAGKTPLEVALGSGKTQVAKMLIELGAQLDAQAELLLLVRNGVSDRDSFDLLIRSGADTNRPDETGEPPLHIAVQRDHLETVKRLILNGADVNAADAAGRLPLTLALAKGRQGADIVKLLEQYGARAGEKPTPAQPEEAQ